MPKQINNKILVVNAYNDKSNNNLTNPQIAKLFNICTKTIYNYVNDDNLTNKIKREPEEFPSDIVDFIIQKAINNHDFNFRSMRKSIKKKFNVTIKKHRLYSILKKNELTYKRANIKNTGGNTKRSLKDIQNLHKKITEINGSDDNIIFTDEMHIRLDDVKTYGWNKKNKEVTFIKNTPKTIRNKRISIIASVSRNKKIGYSIIYGSCDSMKYKKHVKKINKIEHKKYHYQDGASIHGTKLVKNSMKRMGIKSVKGIPYTPELNIIEFFFDTLKRKIKSTEYKQRENISKFVRNSWNSIDDSILSNTYNHIYDNIEFCDRCI